MKHVVHRVRKDLDQLGASSSLSEIERELVGSVIGVRVDDTVYGFEEDLTTAVEASDDQPFILHG